MSGYFTAEILCSLRRSDEPQKWRKRCLRYNTALFLVLSVSCWCLAKLIFTYSSAISFSEFKVSTQCIFRISCDRMIEGFFWVWYFRFRDFYLPEYRYVRILVEFWNPELWNLESSSRNPECREQLESRMLVQLTRNPKSRIHGVESRIQDHLGLNYVGLSY